MVIQNASPRAPAWVLVTGATGLVGNNIVRQLLAQGDSVRVLVRNPDSPALRDLPVEKVAGDIRNESDLDAATRGVDSVVHSAATVQIGWRNAQAMWDTNVGGTANLASAARRANARFVHISTVNTLAVGDGPSSISDERTPWQGREVLCNYVRTKRAAEVAVERERDHGLEAVTLHLGFVVGPWDWKPSSGRMLLAVGRQFTPFAPSGGCSVTDSRDIAAAVVLACSRTHLERHYILAGHNVSYRYLWNRMAKVAGATGPYFTLGPVLSGIVGFVGDTCGRWTSPEPDINSAALRMSRQWHYYSSARAERDLDYRIRPLDETLSDAWRWLARREQVA